MFSPNVSSVFLEPRWAPGWCLSLLFSTTQNYIASPTVCESRLPDVCTASCIGYAGCLWQRRHLQQRHSAHHTTSKPSLLVECSTGDLDIQCRLLAAKTLALCCVGCGEKFQGHPVSCLELVWEEEEGFGTAGACLLCVRWSSAL